MWQYAYYRILLYDIFKRLDRNRAIIILNLYLWAIIYDDDENYVQTIYCTVHWVIQLYIACKTYVSILVVKN